MALTIIFAGTPQFAAHHLQALIDSPHHIAAVYTQPDRPAGRGKKLTPSAVKQLAVEHDIPVEQPLSLKDAEAQQQLAHYNADVMIVVAYGLLLPEVVLQTPRYGCLNVHGSLLPRWRGAAPIQRAVQAGDQQSGVTIMQMDKGLDTGDMLLKHTCDISANETSSSLHDKLMELGAPALLETLLLVEQQQLQPESQDDNAANYAEKISKQEALIDWSQPAQQLDRDIRAFNPFPVAYSFLGKDRIKIYQAAITPLAEKAAASAPGEIIAIDEHGLIVRCGDQALSVSMLQIPGKKAMTISELMNGYSDRFSLGQCFSLEPTT